MTEEANHPVACPPQWLPVLLAANIPTTNGRRLLENVFTAKDDLKTALEEYNANPGTAKGKYGAPITWDVSGITDMSWLFQGLGNINEDISSWDTSGVTDMSGMFEVRALAPNLRPSPSLHAVRTTIAPTALSPPGPRLTPHRMTSLAARQGASAFNQPLGFDTSSVTDMSGMFYVRALAPNLRPSPSLHASRTTIAPTALSPPGPRLTPLRMTSLATRQDASAFNQPLGFVTSSVTDMSYMFTVRALAPNLRPSPSLHAVRTTTAPTALSPPGPHLTPVRMTFLAARQKASAFNQPLGFDTSSVTDMSNMFGVRALAPNFRPSPSLHAARTTTAPTALSPPGPRLTPFA
eukprot:scaffold103768_cov51-Phaeocystis_antarctica.AAC.4